MVGVESIYRGGSVHAGDGRVRTVFLGRGGRRVGGVWVLGGEELVG